jgi:hypothetical protein
MTMIGDRCGRSPQPGIVLAFLSVTTKSRHRVYPRQRRQKCWGVGIPWHRATTRRILTTAPRSANPIGIYVYRCYLQAHGSIIIAFHSEVFRVSLFIFSQRKVMVTNIQT